VRSPLTLAPLDLNDARSVTGSAFADSAIEQDLDLRRCSELPTRALMPLHVVPRDDEEERLLHSTTRCLQSQGDQGIVQAEGGSSKAVRPAAEHGHSLDRVSASL